MTLKATLITAMRNEGPFLVEWVAYHRAIGFTDILIYADDSLDGSGALLGALDAAGVVTHLDNRPRTGTPRGHRNRAYGQAISHPALRGADWAMVLDTDEFLTITAGDGTLAALLAAAPGADLISPAWQLFGHGGLAGFTDAPILPRLLRSSPAGHVIADRHLGIKTLFRPGIVTALGPHRPVLDPAHRDTATWVNGSGADVGAILRDKGWALPRAAQGAELARINHYMIRSTEAFALQNLAQPPLGSEPKPLTLEDYAFYNTNHAEDRTILRMQAATAREAARLMALPEVGPAHTACVTAYEALIAAMTEALPAEVARILDPARTRAEVAEQVNWWATKTAKDTKSPGTVPEPEPDSESVTDGTVAIDPDDVAPRWLADLRRSEHRQGWYYSDTTWAAQYSHRGAEVLVVSFDNLSSVRDPSLARETWGYGFYKSEGWSHLGVMAFEKNWYRDPRLFDFIEGQAKGGFFRRFRRVVLTGTSMGGYAATAFARNIPGCTVVAFSPQSTLDPALVPWEERFGSGRKQDWSGRYRDAPADCAPAARVFIIYDPYFAPDRQHAERYTGDNITLLKSWYASHKSAQFMRRADILKAVMQAAVAGTLTDRLYYRLFRSRRDLMWYYNGLAEHLLERGHKGLAGQLADHLGTIGRPGLARAIRDRI